MRSFAVAVPVFGILLQGLLVWRLSRHRLWVRYPYLSVFVLYSLARDITILSMHLRGSGLYAAAFWGTALVYLFLQFSLTWEFFRGVFPQRSPIHDIAWKVLMFVGLCTFPPILLLSWSQMSSLPSHFAYLSPLVTQYMTLWQVLILLAPLAVARYYGVVLGRNMRGLALGFGIYACIASMNFATVQAFHGFAPYWRFVEPLSFICTIVIWLWAFWIYAPAQAAGDTRHDLESGIKDPTGATGSGVRP